MKEQLELTIIMLPDGNIQTSGPRVKDSSNEFDPVCFFMLEAAKKIMHKHNKKIKESGKPALIGAHGESLN